MTNIMDCSLTSCVFSGHLVRFVVRADSPWFVAQDVCDVLGIQNARDAVAKSLEEDEKDVDSIYTPGGRQDVTLISESGLYALLFQSRKPEAKRFRQWVTGEVLPAIRKQGFYAARGMDPRLAQVEQGRLLLTRARLMTQEAEALRRQAQALLTLADGCNVASHLETLRQDLGRTVTPEAALKFASMLSREARRQNIPVGRDAQGRATYPEAWLLRMSEAHQTSLTFPEA